MSATEVEQKGQPMVTVVPDDQQQVDHNGQPIAPLTPAGLPFRYRLRRPGSAVYGATADDLLAVVIDGYPAEPDSGRRPGRGRGLGSADPRPAGPARFRGHHHPGRRRHHLRTTNRRPGTHPATLS